MQIRVPGVGGGFVGSRPGSGNNRMFLIPAWLARLDSLADNKSPLPIDYSRVLVGTTGSIGFPVRRACIQALL